MNQTLLIRGLAVIGLVSQLSCAGDATVAPPASERLDVTVTSRAMIPGEAVPAVRVTTGSGTIHVVAIREWSCSPIVHAGLSRQSHDLAVVARAYADPLADCFLDPAPRVTEYSATITVIEPGPYRVRVFDALGNDTPRLIGTAGVRVPGD